MHTSMYENFDHLVQIFGLAFCVFLILRQRACCFRIYIYRVLQHRNVLGAVGKHPPTQEYMPIPLLKTGNIIIRPVLMTSLHPVFRGTNIGSVLFLIVISWLF